MTSINTSIEPPSRSDSEEPVVDDAAIAHKLKGHRAKIAGIIKDNSKKSKTTKFKYLATKEELQKLKPQTSIGAGVTLEVAERRVRRITTGEAILDNDDNNNNTNNESTYSGIHTVRTNEDINGLTDLNEEEKNYEDEDGPEEIIDFMKVDSFSQLNSARPADYDSDDENAKPKQNSSKTKAAPPTRKSDIFIGVDEVVDDDGEDLDEIGNLRSIHDIIANKNHSTGSKLRKQESEIDGRFNYATGCDGAQVVYRQCIGSCLIPIFSILKEQPSKPKFAIDWETAMVKKMSAMLEYVKKIFRTSDANHKMMTESICNNILCDGYSSDDFFLTERLLTPSCVEDFDIPENRVNALIRVCQSRMQSIIAALKEKPLVIPERFKTKDDCDKRIIYEIKRLDTHVKQLDKSLYKKQTVKPKLVKKPTTEMFESEVPNVPKPTCFGCLAETKAAKAAREVERNEMLKAMVQEEEKRIRNEEEKEARRVEALPPPCLEFDVKTETFHPTHADDTDVAEGRYLLLLKILLQSNNKHMVTPETSDAFTYDFASSNVQFLESVSADNRVKDQSSARSLKVALSSHTSLRKFASEQFYEDVKGVHALKKIDDLGIEVLQNFAMYYGVDEIHESVMHAIVYMQSFRGAMSLVMQPQIYRSEHVMCLTNCLHNLFNQIVTTRALKKREEFIIQQHLLINVESIIDEAIRNYFKLYPSDKTTGLSEFEDLLRLNVIYYRVQQVILHLHEKEINLKKLNHSATILMWKDIERCLKTRSKEIFQSFKTNINDDKDVLWEYCQKKNFTHTEQWVLFSHQDTMDLALAYVNNDLSKIELSNNITVDLKTFERCNDDGTHISKIRGKVNGVEATPLYAVRWGEAYTVVLEEEKITFSLCYDVYSRKIIVEDIDVFEDEEKKKEVEEKERLDHNKASNRNSDNNNNNNNIEINTGLSIGDHLAYVGDWPTAGTPLGAVYSHLAAVKRPVTLRLYSTVNAAQQNENDFEYTYHVTLSKQEHNGKKYLGLDLAAPKSWTMSYVMKFSRLEDGSILPAERCNRIRQGDLLMAVNGIDVSKADYDHNDTIKLLIKDDILELTFKRIYVHQAIQEKIKVPSLSTYRLQEVVQEARVTLMSDEQYYSKAASTILERQIGRAALKELNSSLLKINALAFYKLIAKEIENWVSRNEPGPGANHYPDGYIVLYNTIADFENQMCDWAGETWRQEYEKHDDEDNFKPLNLKELFGRYVVSWIEHTYVIQTTKFIPNMFQIETWEPEVDDMYPATSKSFMVTLNTLTESYQLLPNHDMLSNVVRFGKQGLCELFKFYANQTKESFRNIALKIKEVQKVPSSTSKDDQLAMYTNKLCVHINAVYRCWSDFIDVLGGLNQIRSVHGFLGMSDSDEDEEESDDIMHKPSMEGSDWADNLNEEEIDPTSKLLTHYVKVRVFSASGIPKMDYGGLRPGDPYVQICVYEEEAEVGNWFETFQTKVINGSQNPVWNENFEFSVVAKNAKVIFRILDYDHGSEPEVIGTVSINLQDYFYQAGEKAGGPKTFKIQPPSSLDSQTHISSSNKLKANDTNRGEIVLLLVSREIELGGSTLRYIDNTIDNMICEPGWGLIDAHVDKIRELIEDYLFDKKKKFRKLPKKIEDIKYQMVEERIDDLIGLMAWCINLIHGNLHERNFARALLRIWRVTIDLFIQFLLPTLDRAYPHLKKKDSWSSWGFSITKKKKTSFDAMKLPPVKDRIKHIDYLNDVQVHMITLAYEEIFSLLNCDGAKAGLKEKKAKEQLGDDLLMLIEMWNIIDTNPAELEQTVTMKTSNIAAQMVLREGEAMETGWDGKAGREWNKLNDSKTHLHHLLLYAAYFKRNKDAINYVESGDFLANTKRNGGIRLISRNSGSFVEHENW